MALGGTRPTALVTGAAGFLGSHLVDRLLAEGYEVVGLDNLMTGNLENLASAGRDPHFHFQAGDVREPIGVYAELVLNFACPASPEHYQADPYATFTTSVLGALRILDLVRGKKARIVHASTSEVYGDPAVSPQPESYFGHVNPIGPRACYDESKRAAETVFYDAFRRGAADVQIVRIFNTYGPRMAKNDGRVVSNFIVSSLTGNPLVIYGDGRQTRSFCYVHDMVDGILAAARTSHHLPINLGTTEELSMLALAEAVFAATGKRTEILHADAAIDDPRQRRPDLTRAKKVLQWNAKVPLSRGLARTVEYFRERI